MKKTKNAKNPSRNLAVQGKNITFASETLTRLTLRKTKMKKKFYLVMAAICSGMSWGSCSSEVWNKCEFEASDQQELRITTRADQPVNESVIYLMDASGACIALLESEGSGNYASGSLAPGHYELYAISSDHLAGVNLPTQEEATASSHIYPSEGGTMGDLLVSHQSFNMQEGQSLSLDLTLDRKVFGLKEVQISQVPSEVTGVSVSIAPLYPGILLDGSYDIGNEPLTYTVQLDQASEGTWSKIPDTKLFPSIGEPQISVIFTLPEGTQTYHFSPAETFAPNREVSIRGTYVGNAIEPEIPVAGGMYKGYYVISVDETNRTAVLLSDTQSKNHKDAKAVEAALKAWPAPEGLTGTCPSPEGLTGTWRLPTISELTTWFNDREAITLENGKWVKYYCKDGNVLTTLELKRSYAGNYTIKGPATEFIGPSTYLAPVIDISW